MYVSGLLKSLMIANRDVIKVQSNAFFILLFIKLHIVNQHTFAADKYFNKSKYRLKMLVTVKREKPSYLHRHRHERLIWPLLCGYIGPTEGG